MIKNKYITSVIKNIKKETEKVISFVLNSKVNARPGQYIMVWLPGVNEKPFGVVNSSPLTLAIAKVGVFTKKLHELKPGDKLTYRGPYGSSFKIKGKNILLVGGGYGVAPLFFLATEARKARKNITVIIGAKNKRDLLFIDKFKSIGCTVFVSTDDGSEGFKGYSPDLFEKVISKKKFDSVYTCGPKIMMQKIARLCKESKIFCQVSVESFFKCGGIGLCGECSCGGKLVCKEGPVFSGNILFEKV